MALCSPKRDRYNTPVGVLNVSHFLQNIQSLVLYKPTLMLNLYIECLYNISATANNVIFQEKCVPINRDNNL